METWTLRPVALKRRFDRRDVQQDLPLCWCVRCGMEVWREGEELCDKCGQREERSQIGGKRRGNGGKKKAVYILPILF